MVSMKGQATISGLLLAMFLAVIGTGCGKPDNGKTLGGGPAGGTFQNVAAGMARFLNQEMPDARIKADHSGGSIDNLLRVERGEIDMALVYSGDAFLGRKGELRMGERATGHVMALARLYGAAAQLIVPQNSPVHKPHDLRKMRIAIGNPGSGSAISAVRFFHSLGIWEDVIPVYVGFNMGLEELRQGNVHAVWMLVGFPNLSLRKFGHEVPIRLIDLFGGTAAGSFFETHPFYTAARIPAGTYPGQDRDVSTFQDVTLWVVNRRMKEAFVYQSLKLLFSEKGLGAMRSADPAAADLTVKKGLDGITIPLHPGAERFWREMGKFSQQFTMPPQARLRQRQPVAVIRARA